MSINSGLNDAILSRLGISQRTLNRRVAELKNQHGPMSGDDARLILAHEAGLNLQKFGVRTEVQDRIRDLRASRGATSVERPRGQATAATTEDKSANNRSPEKKPSAAIQFDSRQFHETVVARARKPFVSGLRQDAVLRAFRSVNNRVKNLTSTTRDGAKLMVWAFSESDPQLVISDRGSESLENEHNGMRYLMQGSMLAMRNPRAHEDHWSRDDDLAYALDSLALASLLHRTLDLSEKLSSS